MTDLEISKALALAIGYLPQHVRLGKGIKLKRQGGQELESVVQVCRTVLTFSSLPFEMWVVFDYSDPDAIWPIAERYGAFPHPVVDCDFKAAKVRGRANIVAWEVSMCDYKRSKAQDAVWLHFSAGTAAKAVALAVIGIHA